MLDVFAEPPVGIQEAPSEVRLNAAGHLVALRDIKLNCVHNDTELREQLAIGLCIPHFATKSWEALKGALTAQKLPRRMCVLLLGYRDFRYRHARLGDELDAALLEVQAELAAQGKQLYLLAAYAETNPAYL